MSIRDHAENRDKGVQWALLSVSMICLGLLAYAAVEENYNAEWVQHRQRYQSILKSKATDDRGVAMAENFDLELAQNFVPRYGTTDRCVACHAGIDDPRMADQPQPYRSHPGRLTEIHPPEQFGCTVCHQGQGRATTAADAHGAVEFWDWPMFETEYAYSACAQCHNDEALYAQGGLLDQVKIPGVTGAGAELLALGRELTHDRGCLGCHILDGKGGKLGPEITLVGEKTRHDFVFSHVHDDSLRMVSNWLYQHFLHPAEISPGSIMPAMAESEGEAKALTAYMLSLRHKIENAPPFSKPDFKPQETLAETGRKLYLSYCSACHGQDGYAGEVASITTPTLSNPDALAIAGDDYYRFIIDHGKSGTQMPSWREGNLTPGEIDAIVAFIRGWESLAGNTERARSRRGDPIHGRSYYQGLCANCHGKNGEGGVGNSLNASTFLGLASDQFLAQTIYNGRPGTAMPSWKQLGDQAISDIVAYMRQWQPPEADFKRTAKLLADHGPADLVSHGKSIFIGNCAGCHGQSGEGGIGPRLNSRDVLPAVDDHYLFRAIAEGRPGTAMPAWRHLSDEKVASLIAFMRSWQPGRLELASLDAQGDAEVGEVHFRNACAACHGDKGMGGIGPQLANPVFMDSVSDATLLHWIGRGRDGTAMLGFLPEEQGPASLKPSQIADVIAYLRREAGRELQPVMRAGMGDPVFGAELYAGNCAGCHGVRGEGASGPQLNQADFLAHASDGFLLGTIALGRTGTAMRSMVHGPDGLGQLPPEQAQDVVAFLRLWDTPQVWHPVRSTADLNSGALANGREIFAANCSSCHGTNGRGSADGEGFFAPALNNPEFLKSASDGFLQATIARGRRGTPMRPFGDAAGGISVLTAGEIADVVSFIRSWQKP